MSEHEHEWYPIKIERFNCYRCFLCGRTVKEEDLDKPIFLKEEKNEAEKR